jgi:hypothetical protein
VLVIRTVVNADPAVRANLVAALTGGRAPGGVACVERADMVTVTFDDELCPPELIDDLITIETHFVPPPPAPDDTGLAAVGLDEPEPDARSVERNLVGLE